MTLLLIAINIAVAFFVLVRPDYVEAWGFRSSEPSIVSAFSSLFVHANAFHLLGNMVFLAAVGVAVEIATGSGRFSLVYLASGLVGVALFWLATRRAIDPPVLVGASGTIAGCAGYYSLRYTSLRVPLAPKRSASVAVVTLAWLVLQIIGAIVNVGQPIASSGFFAHLGGAVAGLILGLVLKAPDLGGRRLGHAVLDALNEADPERQIAHIRSHLESHPDDISMQIRLAEELERFGDEKAEREHLKALIFRASGEEQARFIARLEELDGLEDIAAVRRRQLADTVSPSAAYRLLTSIIQGPKTDPQRPDAMLDLASLLRSSEPESSELILSQLVQEYPLHGATELAKQRGWLS